MQRLLFASGGATLTIAAEAWPAALRCNLSFGKKITHCADFSVCVSEMTGRSHVTGEEPFLAESGRRDLCPPASARWFARNPNQPYTRPVVGNTGTRD